MLRDVHTLVGSAQCSPVVSSGVMDAHSSACRQDESEFREHGSGIANDPRLVFDGCKQHSASGDEETLHQRGNSGVGEKGHELLTGNGTHGSYTRTATCPGGGWGSSCTACTRPRCGPLESSPPLSARCCRRGDKRVKNVGGGTLQRLI